MQTICCCCCCYVFPSCISATLQQNTPLFSNYIIPQNDRHHTFAFCCASLSEKCVCNAQASCSSQGLHFQSNFCQMSTFFFLIKYSEYAKLELDRLFKCVLQRNRSLSNQYSMHSPFVHLFRSHLYTLEWVKNRVQCPKKSMNQDIFFSSWNRDVIFAV